MNKCILMLVVLSCLMVAIQARPFVFPSTKIWGKVSGSSLVGRSNEVGYNPDETTLRKVGSDFCEWAGESYESLQVKTGDLIYGDYFSNLDQTLTEAGIKDNFSLVVKCKN